MSGVWRAVPRLDEVRDIGLTVETEPNGSDVGAIERGLFAFEEARLGNPDHRHFAVFVRDEAGQPQGGVDCHVMWRRLFVKTLWLAEPLRGRGIGTRMMQTVEAEAARRGCRSVWLTALGDQACRFYRKIGYRIFGVHDDYVGGQSLYSLRKDFE